MPLRKNSGLTLTELVMAVAIFSLIILGVQTFFSQGITQIRLIIAKIDIQREARANLSLMNKELRQAVASSIVISRENANQPPYSKIMFETIKGTTVYYYQEGVKLYQDVYTDNSAIRRKFLAENLRFVHFVFPKSDDDSILQVSACFEKIPYPYVTGIRALQVSIEKVRIMN
ncbi:MAG: prepilin-type N-terminal cleavage/methylation domain-containing protein [Elusimicrobia bacterium]|nr:prepilin-type N-terminal cleavage/methylation domain-containing protein [Elusimicrobiota bacterium]